MKFKAIVEPCYYEADGEKRDGQDCSVCPFRDFEKGEVCGDLFYKEFGASCSTHAVVFIPDADNGDKDSAMAISFYEHGESECMETWYDCKSVPRVGEYVELDNSRFEVVMVYHMAKGRHIEIDVTPVTPADNSPSKNI